MDRIYLVGSIRHYIEDLITDRFAVDVDGIRRIVMDFRREVYREGYHDPSAIGVDLDKMEVTVPDEDGWLNTYYIHEVTRI